MQFLIVAALWWIILFWYGNVPSPAPPPPRVGIAAHTADWAEGIARVGSIDSIWPVSIVSAELALPKHVPIGRARADLNDLFDEHRVTLGHLQLMLPVRH